MNKAVECFGGTSAKQTWHVQSLTDILQKIIPKRVVSKTVDTRPFFSSHVINMEGPGYEANKFHACQSLLLCVTACGVCPLL